VDRSINILLLIIIKMVASAASRRTALVCGVANARSIAWASARSLLRSGYDVVCTYQSERFASQVERLVTRENEEILQAARSRTSAAADVDGSSSSVPKIECLPCDVSCDDSVRSLFRERLPSCLSERRLDALIHSVAYAPPDAMKDGTLLTTSRESFGIAHDVSSYSLILMARHALPMMSASSWNDSDGSNHSGGSASASITALSYLGATRAVPNYNAMGPAKASLESVARGLALELGPPPHEIRVNAVSAGPMNTMAAKGIRGFTAMRADSEDRSMLRRNVTVEEVADAVVFLTGATGITGQTLHVDGGYSSVAGPIIR
jgi:enoyl-[acyl-carrier protein] reductase I